MPLHDLPSTHQQAESQPADDGTVFLRTRDIPRHSFGARQRVTEAMLAHESRAWAEGYCAQRNEAELLETIRLSYGSIPDGLRWRSRWFGVGTDYTDPLAQFETYQTRVDVPAMTLPQVEGAPIHCHYCGLYFIRNESPNFTYPEDGPQRAYHMRCMMELNEDT